MTNAKGVLEWMDWEKKRKANMTNEQWFCGLSTEEKAKVLYNFFMARTFCHICPENNVCDIGYKCKYGNGEVEDFIKWLKQPHTDRE